MSTDPTVVGGRAAGRPHRVCASANVPRFFALAGEQVAEHMAFLDVATAIVERVRS